MNSQLSKKDFVTCGLVGWCLEVFWTGTGSLFRGDPSLKSNTSLLMFPIYALAAFLKPLYKLIADKPVAFRGTVYALCIYAVEYTSGSILKKLGACPWNYEQAKYNIKGIIRLDFAPAWFTVGLLYEKLLNPIQSRSHTN